MARIPRRSERAQSLSEFALIVPLLIILIFGVVDFGMALRAYITVAQATREGARYASVGNLPGTFTAGGAGDCDGTSEGTAVGKVCTALENLNLSNVEDVSVTYPDGEAPGNSVRVSAEYEYNFITPLDSILNFLGSSSDGTITVSATTDMRLE